MKLEPVQVSVVGSYKSLVYGLKVIDATQETLQEMKDYAKSVGGRFISNTIWFDTESARTMFILRWT